MKLNYYVVHEIKRVDSTMRAIKSPSLPTDQELGKKLTEKLIEAYKEKETYGRFNPELDNETETQQFPFIYKSFLKDEQSETFLEFTKTVVDDLAKRAQSAGAKGAYVLFIDYSTQGGNFTSIFLVRDTEGFIFKKSNEEVYTIESLVRIDTEKLAMACRLNKGNILSAEAKNHLTFIRTPRQKTSDFFIDWLCATELHLNTEYTDTLVSIIKEIELPEIDGKKITRDELHAKVYELCKANPSRKINLIDLSKELFGDSKEGKLKIINYAAERGMMINTEFSYDGSSLNKLRIIQTTADNITVRFKFSDRNKIRYHGDKIYIESAELVEALKREANISPAQIG